jgi:drug/metabolite transporter (DMT)-like permease
MAAGQFLVCGILCAIVLLPLRNQLPPVRALLHQTLAIRDIALLTLLPTLLAYGLLSHFQPRVDPTRAAILYLAEPIFAALYARAALGETMTSRQISGAALILVANGVVEVVAKRRASPVPSFAQEQLGLGLEVHEDPNARPKE